MKLKEYLGKTHNNICLIWFSQRGMLRCTYFNKDEPIDENFLEMEFMESNFEKDDDVEEVWIR